MKNILDNLTCVVRLLISHSRLSLNIVSSIIYIFIILVRIEVTISKRSFLVIIFNSYHVNTLTNKINYHPKSIKIHQNPRSKGHLFRKKIGTVENGIFNLYWSFIRYLKVILK